jgi:hypothetical protein
MEFLIQQRQNPGENDFGNEIFPMATALPRLEKEEVDGGAEGSDSDSGGGSQIESDGEKGIVLPPPILASKGAALATPLRLRTPLPALKPRPTPLGIPPPKQRLSGPSFTAPAGHE